MVVGDDLRAARNDSRDIAHLSQTRPGQAGIEAPLHLCLLISSKSSFFVFRGILQWLAIGFGCTAPQTRIPFCARILGWILWGIAGPALAQTAPAQAPTHSLNRGRRAPAGGGGIQSHRDPPPLGWPARRAVWWSSSTGPSRNPRRRMARIRRPLSITPAGGGVNLTFGPNYFAFKAASIPGDKVFKATFSPPAARGRRPVPSARISA